MGIGVSLILIAVGAILTWAVNASVSGLDITTVGVILMIVGVVGLLLSLVFWASWGGWPAAGPGGGRRRTTTTVDDADSYEQEGPLTTFFDRNGGGRLSSAFTVRLASFRTSRIIEVRLAPDQSSSTSVSSSTTSHRCAHSAQR